MAEMTAIEIECDSCKGTGLYVGFMEGKGQAVICVNCRGSGGRWLHYIPFTGRKKREGIERIRSGTGMIIDQPTEGSWMTYAKFEELILLKN